MQTIFICCVTVPRAGPGVRDGLILPNEMIPILVSKKEQGGVMVTLYVLVSVVFVGAELSVRVTSKEKVPDRTGVPDITAVSEGDGAGLKKRPGGRLPFVMDQE